jgi:hypothetical protein
MRSAEAKTMGGTPTVFARSRLGAPSKAKNQKSYERTRQQDRFFGRPLSRQVIENTYAYLNLSRQHVENKPVTSNDGSIMGASEGRALLSKSELEVGSRFSIDLSALENEKSQTIRTNPLCC